MTEPVRRTVTLTVEMSLEALAEELASSDEIINAALCDSSILVKIGKWDLELPIDSADTEDDVTVLKWVGISEKMSLQECLAWDSLFSAILDLNMALRIDDEYDNGEKMSGICGPS